MDFDQARYTMIKQQIIGWKVLEPNVVDCLFAVKREQFVPARYRNLAFAEIQIPLGHGEYMLMPGVEARIANALHLKASDRVLEIGTGSGHMAALLAARAQQVESIEIVPELVETARANLASARIANVTVKAGNGLDPATIHDNYDVIVLSGSLPLLPQHMSAHLNIGGRMIAIVGVGVNMEVQLIVRGSESSYTTTCLFETVAPALQNAPQRSAFAL